MYSMIARRTFPYTPNVRAGLTYILPDLITMEPKKTARADLSKKSFLFFNIGLVSALSLTIFAFTYKTSDNINPSDLADNQSRVEELIEVPITEQQVSPPPKIEQPRIIEVINEEKIEEDLNIDMDAETNIAETNPQVVAVRVEVEEEDPNTLFTIVEESANPVGGINSFNQFVSNRLVYPPQARRMGIQGKVYIEFIVERDGSITNVRTLKGIGAGCDEEAVRVVGLAPKWNPGKQRGRPVRQKMILPIIFSTN
jgi:periplasmic protein TonB